MIRVAIIDDHYVVRFGLKYMLQLDKELVFAGEAADASDPDFVGRADPDVLLLDLMLPGKDGLAAFAEIRAAHPRVKVVMLTTSSKEEDVYRAISAGVDGYVLKDSPPSEIVRAIRAVAEGGRFFPEKVLAVYSLREGEKGVSAREAEVLRYMAKGLTNGEMADLMKVSVETMKTQVKSAFTKLGVADRAEAVAVAIARGVIGEGS